MAITVYKWWMVPFPCVRIPVSDNGVPLNPVLFSIISFLDEKYQILLTFTDKPFFDDDIINQL
jgi:hypothetical protein